MLEYILFVLTGILAGTAAGLLGIGGGVIVVPGLAFILHIFGFNIHVAMHVAIATSLTVMVFTSSVSVYSHNRRGAVVWPIFFQLLPGILVGTIGGVLLASIIPTHILKLLFALFLLFISFHMFFTKESKIVAVRNLPGEPWMSVVGLFIGAKSGLLGVGGGMITVPFLTWCGIPLRQASGTSSAVTFPIAITGSLSTIYTGWGVTENHYTIGFIYWPAALIIAIASMLAVYLGARLSLILPHHIVKRVFALILVIGAVNLLR